MTLNAFCHLRGLNRFFFLSASGLRWRRLSASIARRFRSMTAGFDAVFTVSNSGRSHREWRLGAAEVHFYDFHPFGSRKTTSSP
jgi:hypothetical protein